jgi:hypothetical protein
MNIDEYRARIEKAHTTTGVPTYWEELVKWRKIADELALRLRQLEYFPSEAFIRYEQAAHDE